MIAELTTKYHENAEFFQLIVLYHTTHCLYVAGLLHNATWFGASSLSVFTPVA